jgi:hypothetical protein
MNETVWAKELLAEECGRPFEILWDKLNAATNKLRCAVSFAVPDVLLGDWGAAESLAHGIQIRRSTGPGVLLAGSKWADWLDDFARIGWQLANVELRQVSFDTDANGQPQQSHFDFSAFLNNPPQAERVIVEGDLVIYWSASAGRQMDHANTDPNDDVSTIPALSQAVKQIDASHLVIKSRRGEPPFHPVLIEQVAPAERTSWFDPVLVYDLDGDGFSEIILAARNLVYRRQANGSYRAEPLCRFPGDPIFTAVLADFNGDGAADFLCATSKGLVLFKGSAQGTFDQPGELVWSASPHLVNPMVLTCGDIDEDGDLDVFLGQYRVPNLGQIFRPSFYDANDSYPAYLLVNDGHGHFTEGTGAGGLEPKRRRRVFSASFVDLDNDGHLDLAVASDFSGLDLFRNDGHGRFTEVTHQWVPDAKAFGMAQTVADFNRDGRLDLLLLGMNSPTVDRLEHLHLTRPGAGDDSTMRRRMTYGNRLFLRTDAGFAQTTFGESMAHSGWSWGCAAGDFDNDGFPDIYITNGNETRQQVRDYDSEFWLHDIYVEESVSDVEASAYFLKKFERTRGQGWSYRGHENNRLFLNLGAERFLEAAHLLGMALPEDSRCAVAEDLDGDGRMDLIVTTLEVWPEKRQTFRIYQNRLEDAANWIGFRFREQRGRSPVGVQVTLHYANHEAVGQIVTGDSFRSQQATSLHFGLGAADRVESADIRWTGGRRLTLREPAVNRYHWVDAQ